MNYYLTITCNEIHHQSILRFFSDYNKISLIDFKINKFIYSGIIELKHSDSFSSDQVISNTVDMLIPDLLFFLNESYSAGVFLDYHIRKDLVFDVLDR
jgi:hypothetical protein